MPQSLPIMAPSQPQVGSTALRQSLWAVLSIVLFLDMSAIFFTFPCRWLVGQGEWAFALVTGLLFILTLWTMVSLNISDPGILHRGTLEQDPEAAHTAWMFRHAFQMPWCHQCRSHRPPRTLHCDICKICVEEYHHHCRWVNNCVGHRNFRTFLLLLVSLCLYLVVVLGTCIYFLVRTREMPMLVEKTMAFIVAVPALLALLPLIFGLLIQAATVSKARHLYELQENNPFDQGCIRNCFITLCAPLGSKYMSEAVLLQHDGRINWKPIGTLQSSTFSPAQHGTELPGPSSQTVYFDTSRQGPSGSVEAAVI